MPRCPTCRYPVPTPGLCAVCQAQAPVHRITAEEMRVTWDAKQGPLQAVTFPPTPQRPARPLRGAVLRSGVQVTVSCEEAGCGAHTTLTSQGRARIKGRGQLVRCPACKAAHQRTYQRDYQAQRRQEAKP